MKPKARVSEVEGVSGLRHTIEIIDFLGEKMVYLEVDDYTTDTDIYKAFFIALDTGMGLYLKCHTRPPAWILDSAGKFHIIIELLGSEDD